MAAQSAATATAATAAAVAAAGCLRFGNTPPGIGQLGIFGRPCKALFIARDQFGLGRPTDLSSGNDVKKNGSAPPDRRSSGPFRVGQDTRSSASLGGEAASRMRPHKGAARNGLGRASHGWRVAKGPHALVIVEATDLRAEQVDDHVAGVEQDPVGSGKPFELYRPESRLFDLFGKLRNQG